MNKDIIVAWENDWEYITKIAKKRKWDSTKIKISAKAKLKEIEKVEQKHSIKFPVEFKEVLLNYSSAVYFSWQIQNEETVGILKEVFCGCGRGYLWDLSIFDSLFETYNGWLKSCFKNIYDSYDKVWYNKIPIIHVPNGDIIAFDINQSSISYPVVYLSHDDGELHGNTLGKDFIDFITRWSNISCIGTESWQIEPFYDYENHVISSDNDAVQQWKKWMEI